MVLIFPEKDWKGIKMLPEYNTLMSQFGNQKHRCVCTYVCLCVGGGGEHCGQMVKTLAGKFEGSRIDFQLGQFGVATSLGKKT